VAVVVEAMKSVQVKGLAVPASSAGLPGTGWQLSDITLTRSGRTLEEASSHPLLGRVVG
jgi:hypothetical protein